MKTSSELLPSCFRSLHLKSCSSTQDSIKKAESKWFLLRADRQEAGRGQHDRSWQSPIGGLYYSLKCPHPSSEKGNTPLHLLRAAYDWLCLFRRRYPEYAECFQLKWPNDLLYKDYKLGGFIGEKSGKNLYIGVGINVNNQFNENEASAFRLPPISLRSVTGAKQPIGVLLMDWFRSFYSFLGSTSSETAPNLASIEEAMRTVGRTVRYQGKEGKVLGLASNGGLSVRVKGTERVVQRTEDVEVIEK